MFRRILVAFDGSLHAQAALTDAIELAQANRATLTVMAVVPDSDLWLGAAVEVPVNLGGLESAEREYAAMLDRAVAVLHSSPVPVLVVRRCPTSSAAAVHPRHAETATRVPA